jgi:hypothetical protein
MADLFLGGLVDAASHERIGDGVDGRLTVPTDSLTTHGVIVGMTGSGKTGLGIVLIEEALRAGVPVLAIDPKGDLTNLALTFPTLSAAEFRPWIDEAQAKAAGQDPDEFAAAQATTWTEGLDSWGLSGTDIAALRAAADFTIYTPGSTSGQPIDLVGSLQVPGTSDPEIVADEINGFVTGLLGLVDLHADPLTSREHILLSNIVDSSWKQGRSLDLVALVQMVSTPPMRKLGVFELDEFFPPKDRTALALRLNGLLAAPSFASWAQGVPLDIEAMLFAQDRSPRCAIVTTAHLTDEERQFVTALILSKLVTWMRRQSGTTDLRAMLYMDEVAGYLPPTEKPPTKQPIMLLMKQARAFGVGVVLSTQNPVDLDYKALSNAGTWMIGRLQTDRDKARVLDGMSSAAGSVDIEQVDATITGLAKREFVLRRAGKDHPEVFTTRWAMSYLRGPMTRDQIASLTVPPPPVEGGPPPPEESPAAWAPPSVGAASASTMPAPGAGGVDADALAGDTVIMMPAVATGVAVRYVDPAAPWLTTAGGSAVARSLSPAVVARVALRYDETKADLVHDVEHEIVVHPIDDLGDVSRMIQVDYDERDLLDEPPVPLPFHLPPDKADTKTFWSNIERNIRDHLVRSLSMTIPTNARLKLFGRPGESAEEFTARCRRVASERADAEVARLRPRYEAKAVTLRDRIEAATDQHAVAREQAEGKRNSEFLSTAGSILGGLLGGRKSADDMLGEAGTAARRRGTTSAAEARVDAAANKVERLQADLLALDGELAADVAEITAKWAAVAADVGELNVGLERNDVKVTQIVCAWLPVA